jgi:hypothetical protein
MTSRFQNKATPEYAAYCCAKRRCDNPNDHAYKDYGGRDIKFLFESFEQFFAEVGPRPPGKHPSGRALYSIHRINNDGHYEPGNVKWATDKEQNAPGAHRRIPRTHCRRGHEFTEANTYRGKRGRQCLACMRRCVDSDPPELKPVPCLPGVRRPKEPSVSATATRLRKGRILSGLTLDQLSRMVGITGPTLCKFERGFGRLRPEQIEGCEKALRETMVAQLAEIDALMGDGAVAV